MTRVWDEVARFDSDLPIERASMPPSSWYVESAFHGLEQRAVFQATWQPVCQLTAVIEPGSYTAGCVADMPWVVVRDLDGQLRAFHNVCSHKGREVVTGSGRAEDLVCGYHAWSYRLDGRLRKAPRVAGILEFDLAAMALRPMAVELWGPWVFVHPNPAAAPLRARLQHLDDALERSDWATLTFAARREWVIACNWKVLVDNYLDGGYHIPHMHPTLDAQLDMATYRTELFDEYSIQTSDATGSQDAVLGLSPSDRIGSGAIYAWLYPNFMINRYGPCMDSNLVTPIDSEHCKVVYEFYFDESKAGAREFVERSIEQAEVTQQEDIEICESVQIGLRSPAYDRGRYAPRVETGEYHFHRLLAAAFETYRAEARAT